MALDAATDVSLGGEARRSLIKEDRACEREQGSNVPHKRR